MGIFPLILGRVRLMGLNSHLRTNNYVPSHVDVHPSAHPLYTLRILRCISSTIHLTLVTINKLQIQHMRVEHCTSGVCSCRSGFRLWTKIFTTTRRAGSHSLLSVSWFKTLVVLPRFYASARNSATPSLEPTPLDRNLKLLPDSGPACNEKQL